MFDETLGKASDAAGIMQCPIREAMQFDAGKLLQNLHIAVIIIDADTFRIRWTNHGTDHLLGLPSNQIIGRNCREILCSSHDQTCPFRILKQNTHTHEFEINTPDGRTIPVLKTVQRMRFKGREVFVETITDISEQKRIFNQLQESEKRFRNMTDMLPEAVFEADTQLRVTYANPAGLNMFGFTQKDLDNGISGLDIFVPEERERVRRNIWRRLKGSLTSACQYTAIRTDGSTFPILFNPTIIYVDGVYAGSRGIIVDLSERKRMDELSKARELAEETNRAKDIFLENMTHELRTPLTPIIGFTDIMMDADNLTPSQKEFLQIIRQRAHHMLRLVNGIVDVVKVETEKIELNCQPIDIVSLLEDIHNFFKERLEAKRIDYSLRLNESLPSTIYTDPTRLQQIILNLVDNAVTFTHSGRIDVQADYVEDETGSQFHLIVRDTGCGIPQDKLPHIFDHFYQTADSHNNAQKGTGLGLSICQRLARRMGGDITVTSTPGEGSEFHVRVKVLLPSQ
jgi:PAS domain S-box-containing protein